MENLSLTHELRMHAEDLHSTRGTNKLSSLLSLYADEIAAWRARFPQYEYRQQDECVALRMRSNAELRGDGQEQIDRRPA